jgi:hypothetical protein
MPAVRPDLGQWLLSTQVRHSLAKGDFRKADGRWLPYSTCPCAHGAK